MKLPPSLEATLLEPPVTSACPSICPFNGTCPAPVQRAAEKLWMAGLLTPQNFTLACYRFPHLKELWTSYTGRVEAPTSAEELREVLTERVALQDIADAESTAPVDNTELMAIQERVLKYRDRARQRREAETKAAYDAAHPQQELGV